MSNKNPNALSIALRRVLRPLFRLLLRNGMAYADFVALARKEFVEVAANDFVLPGRKQSVSRISVITGINRKEVKKILDEPNTSPAFESNRAARVVCGWIRDDQFRDQNRKPLPLSVASPGNQSFDALVKKHGGDTPPRSVLDELVRVGAVQLEKDTVKLAASGYVPTKCNEELLLLSGEGISDLISTIDHNLNPEVSQTRLQLRVAYDDVPASGVELFRSLSTDKCVGLLTELDEFLASKDRSINPQVEGKGRYRTGIGVYYFEEPYREPEVSPASEPLA